MNAKKLKRLPTMMAVVLVVMVVAACAIRLRGDERQALSTSSADQASDPLATMLAACRSVTYEQKEVLSECRKAWAKKRRQFLGQETPSTASDDSASQGSSFLFVQPKDESRLSPGYPPIQQSGKE